ncbi:hypothetical protein LEP1GSC077_2075 [Leptospira interrogans str. C10069]|nr:hypothetical protein LEP1GSC077_2075 [Leptospira interrogans str. C10069]
MNHEFFILNSRSLKLFPFQSLNREKIKNPEDLEICRVLLIQRRFKIGISLLR